ncbi:MAG: hypothetical protein GY747_08135 [Planctomycetes bacterium]|nr:hypothetical protein [Planctomycetota bacterium]MCP4771150.1 hypothetical protein [Planctomycetota bacterium]MCP4862123.1 hypothetical protein [Planctomycetota bacterium]
MAAAIKNALGIIVKLIEGGGGIFEVNVDGQVIFNKINEGNQFPDEDDIIRRTQTL